MRKQQKVNQGKKGKKCVWEVAGAAANHNFIK